jgi:hypothetical protein
MLYVIKLTVPSMKYFFTLFILYTYFNKFGIAPMKIEGKIPTVEYKVNYFYKAFAFGSGGKIFLYFSTLSNIRS